MHGIYELCWEAYSGTFMVIMNLHQQSTDPLQSLQLRWGHFHSVEKSPEDWIGADRWERHCPWLSRPWWERNHPTRCQQPVFGWDQGTPQWLFSEGKTIMIDFVFLLYPFSPSHIGRKHVSRSAVVNKTLLQEVGVPRAGPYAPVPGLLPELVRIF